MLDPDVVPPEIGWRAAFAIGGVLGLAIMLLRRHVPESPRWLMVHGRVDEAEAVVDEIEARVGGASPSRRRRGIRLHSRRATRPVARRARHRETLSAAPVLGLVLMAAQAFFYNAIFFTYALVLTRFLRRAAGPRRAVYVRLRASAISSGRCCSAASSTRSAAGR